MSKSLEYFLPRDGGFIATAVVRAICPFDRVARDSRDFLQPWSRDAATVRKKEKKEYISSFLWPILSCYTIPLSVLQYNGN